MFGFVRPELRKTRLRAPKRIRAWHSQTLSVAGGGGVDLEEGQTTQRRGRGGGGWSRGVATPGAIQELSAAPSGRESLVVRPR